MPEGESKLQRSTRTHSEVMPREEKETPEPIVRAFDPQLKTMSSSKVLSPTTSLTDVTPSCELRIKGWRSAWEGEALKLPHDSTTHRTQLDRHSPPRSGREEEKKKHRLTHVIAINCKKVHGQCSQRPHKVSQWGRAVFKKLQISTQAFPETHPER